MECSEDIQDKEEVPSKSEQTIPIKGEHLREQIRERVLGKSQVSIAKKYKIYELLQSTPNFDLYRAICLKQLSKKFIRLKQLNITEKTTSDPFERCIFKQQLTKTYEKPKKIFLSECVQIFESQSFRVHVFNDFYGQKLEKMIQRKGSLQTNEALAILKQVILGYFELRQLGIDVKQLLVEDIVFSNGMFRIFDLERLAEDCDLRKENALHPPEIIHEKKSSSESIIWFLGVMFYQMVCSNQSYHHRVIDLKRQVKSRKFQFETKTGEPSKDVLYLLSEMLQEYKIDRISWKRLIDSEPFSNSRYFASSKSFPIVDPRPSTLINKFSAQKDLNLNTQLEQFKNQEKRPLLSNSQLFIFCDQKDNLNPHKFREIEEEVFFNLKKFNINMVKAQFLYNNVVTNIEQYGLIDMKRRSHLQMMYLIISRCFFYSSKSFNSSRFGDIRVENYNNQVKGLYLLIKSKMNSIRESLIKMQKSTYYIGNDIISSVVKSAKIKKKEKFMMMGKEGVDFSIQDHIYYTQDAYIDKILKEMKGQPKILRQVKNILNHYDKINEISEDQTEGNMCFEMLVDRVMKK